MNKESFDLFKKIFYNYHLKIDLVTFNSYIYKFYSYYDNIDNINIINEDYKKLMNQFKKESVLDLLNLSVADFNYYKSLIISRKNKKKILNKRLNNYFCNYDNVYFVTLTLDKKYLSYKCIDRYIKKYLRDHFVSYVFNKDYGDLNGRLHYHGIVPNIDSNLLKIFKNNNYNLVNYNYGFSSVKKINLDSNIKINSYMLKISQHSLKFSTGLDNLIYSIDKS